LGLPLNTAKLPKRFSFFVAVTPEKSTVAQENAASDFSANQPGQK
jgi:hypothetical protein